MSDDGFIGLPPGMTPPLDSGTVRKERVERPRAEREPITFFTSGPGAPPIAPTVDAPVEVPVEVQPDDEVAVETRLVASRHTASSWYFRIPGETEPVAVPRRLFLGRAPVTVHGVEGDVLAVSDPAKSVSKTHAMVEIDESGLWVHDLDSTNGVWVVPEGGDPIEVVPGTRAALPPGADLELGEFVIQVEYR